MNVFEIAHAQRGTITPAQEQALINLVTKLGRARFAQYRALAGVTAPIPRLSKGEAWRLINLISKDLGG